jgi:hypothetical protein
MPWKEVNVMELRKQFIRDWMRISSIVDAHFSLIVDGKTVLPVTCWGECASTGFECS